MSSPSTTNQVMTAFWLLLGVGAGAILHRFGSRWAEELGKKEEALPPAFSPRSDRLFLALTAAVTGGIYAWAARGAEGGILARELFFLSLLVLVSVVDLRCGLVPDELIAAGLAGWAALWPWARTLTLAESLGGLAFGFGLFLFLALLSRGGIGGGDVKLAALMGLYLGPWGMMRSLLLAFLAGGVISGFLLLTRRKGRKDPIPFAPFLALGAAAGILGEGWWLWPLR